MNREIYKYEFSPNLPIQEVERSLALSVLTTESLHGRSQVRMDASFIVDKEKHACVIDADTEVGRDIARIFTGYLTREFGENAFKVKRLSRDSSARLSASTASQTSSSPA